MTSKPEIVITGIGVVSPIGIGLEAFWESLASGKSGVRIRPGFEEVRTRYAIAAPIPGFDGKLYVKPRKSIKVMCRQIQFGFAAATMAVEDAGLPNAELNPERIATVFGGEAYYANPEELLDVFRKCIQQGGTTQAWGDVAMREIEPLWMLKYLPNMVASHISIAIDARGPSNSIVQGDNSSLLAIIEGIDVLERGMADIAVVGATGSQMSETAMVYRGNERLSKNFQDPTAACRPFDAQRDGTVSGEGSAAFVIETREHAVKRGAKIMATIRGFDRAFCPPGNNAATTNRIAKSIEDALSTSGVAKSEIGHVNSNGTGVVDEDSREAKAIARVLGDVPVFAGKSYFGNVGPASGAIELACSVLAVQKKLLPATLNYQSPDPECPVNVTNQQTKLEKLAAVVLNQNHTGQIATLVISGS